jgi:ubiquinone/menaquinone biosynthesis C-methylase UbiE
VSPYDEKLRKHFDDLAGSYCDVERAVQPRVLEAVAERIDDGTVIDVACGPGVVARYLRERRPGIAVAGVDLSWQMCRAAHVAGIPAAQGIAERLPFRDRSADTIVCEQAMHYFDLPCTLTDWARVLRPGGAAVIAQIGSVSATQTAWWRMVKASLQPQRRRWFALDELASSLQFLGWTLRTTRVVEFDTSRTVDEFFATGPSDPDERHRLLEEWASAAPPEVALHTREGVLMFRQTWLVWTMTPGEAR